MPRDVNMEMFTKIVPVRAVEISIGPFCTEFRCERFSVGGISLATMVGAGCHDALATMVRAGCLRLEVFQKFAGFFSGYFDAGPPIVARARNVGMGPQRAN